MRPRPSIHLELPALPAPSAVPAGAAANWWQAVEVAGRAGAQGLWFSGGPIAGPGEWCDPLVLAGGAVPLAARSALGVASAVPAGRHPAVLARDVTALDVVSKGRAAVLLTPGGSRTGDPPASGADPRSTCQLLTEAAAVCRAVLSDANPVFEGRYFHVAGAVNRPRPLRDGGPPLLVEVPPGWPELVEAGGVDRDLGGRLVGTSSAIVCTGGPAELAACRKALDGLRSQPPALWWRGPVRTSKLPAHAGAFEELRVDGVVLQMPPPGAGDPRGDDLVLAVEAALTRAGRDAC